VGKWVDLSARTIRPLVFLRRPGLLNQLASLKEFDAFELELYSFEFIFDFS
jgi:hypothetical protein